MKIMLVTNLFGALARGGAERVVLEEAGALAASGHDVVVVSGEPKRVIPKGVCLPGEPWLCPPPGSAEEVRAAYEAAVKRATKPGQPREVLFSPPNIAFYGELERRSAPFRLLWHAKDIWNGRAARIFAGIIGYERPDVVHTHNLMGLGFGIPGVLRRAGVRHVHTVHDVQLLDPSGLLRGDRTFRPALHQSAYIAVMRRRMGSPRTVVFPSEFIRDLHLKHGFFKDSYRVVLRNPCAPPGERRAAMSSPPHFLFAGQLERHKGVLTLLDAWKDAATGGAVLEIAGAGSLDAIVRRKAALLPRVEVLGKLDQAGLAAAYARADWVVVPSTVIENAPSVLMEALGRGIPAIASGVGGIPELVRHGETGYLFQPGSVEGLRELLTRATASGGTYVAMSARAVAAVAGLDARAHAETLLSVYAK